MTQAHSLDRIHPKNFFIEKNKNKHFWNIISKRATQTFVYCL